MQIISGFITFYVGALYDTAQHFTVKIQMDTSADERHVLCNYIYQLPINLCKINPTHNMQPN